MQFVPVEIVGVVTEDVGAPRNNGSPGSALYLVPVRLSRALTAEEGEFLARLWDRPPSWTSMHRPGIARVRGDRFLLDGTTIDEVSSYHARTLRLVVDEFNSKMQELHTREAEKRQRAEAAAEDHRRHVEDLASEIRFE